MLRALDRIPAAKLAIPFGIIAAAGLVLLGLTDLTWALFVGGTLLGVALLLSLSARWQLEGNPDPVTAGVHFEAPDQPAARWIGWACVILGGGVLAYGAWDTAQARLTTAWDPLRGALAVSTVQLQSDAPADQRDNPTDAMLRALKRQRDDLRAAAAAPKTQSKRQAPAKAPWEGKRERPAMRVGADGKALPEAPEGDAVATGTAAPQPLELEYDEPGKALADDESFRKMQLAREAAEREADPLLNATDRRAVAVLASPKTDSSRPVLPEQLSESQIKRVFAVNAPTLKECRRYAIGASTMVKVTVTVGRSGRVKSATMHGTAMGTGLAECVDAAVKRLEFPPFSGKDMRINIPVRL